MIYRRFIFRGQIFAGLDYSWSRSFRSWSRLQHCSEHKLISALTTSDVFFRSDYFSHYLDMVYTVNDCYLFCVCKFFCFFLIFLYDFVTMDPVV